MKLHILICLILLFSCGKLKDIRLGSELISDKQFVNNLENLCRNETDPKCPLEKLQTSLMDTTVHVGHLTLEFVTKNSSDSVNDIDVSETKLFVKNGNSLVEEIVVAQTRMGMYFYHEKLFYLNNEFELWMLEYFVTDDPNNLTITNWALYEIDKNTGNCSLKKVFIKKE